VGLDVPEGERREMKHGNLVSLAERHLRSTRRCVVVMTERGAGMEIPDAIGWLYSGKSILIECKRSLSDFYSDRKKLGRQFGSVNMGQERWYLTPKGLLKNCHTLPDGWGLLEVRGDRVFRIREATPQKEWNQHSEKKLLISEIAHWQLLSTYYNIPCRSWEEKSQIIHNANGFKKRNLVKREAK